MFKDYARITASLAKKSVIETFEVDTVMAKNTLSYFWFSNKILCTF